LLCSTSAAKFLVRLKFLLYCNFFKTTKKIYVPLPEDFPKFYFLNLIDYEMRYFLHLAYLGKNYNGWQVQPNAPSVQQTIEKVLTTILRAPTEIVGCGRTDTGVHATHYYAHFDISDVALPSYFLHRVNKMLPSDIVIYDIFPIEKEAHARFDAYRRAYEYHIGGLKNPFLQDTTTFIYDFEKLDYEKMQIAARLLLDYQTFAPFCKSDHDAKTLDCTLYRSEWIWDFEEKKAIYHIEANRFLRGMVRLIVGMCLEVGRGKTTVEEVKNALDRQTLLVRSHSAPPQGLALTKVLYPFFE
jgi:tRNA pseudouridine38-40 synthase